MNAARWGTALHLVLLLPVASGCGLLEPCGRESRDVEASTSGSTFAGANFAHVLLVQDRGSRGSLFWSAQNTALPPGEVDSLPLDQHVVSARLLDGGAGMALLLELPVERIESLAEVGGQLQGYTGPVPFAQLFALVRDGRAVLELGTDIPGQEQMFRVLGTVVFRDWRRIPCD